jgi:hypothetical protein
MDSGVDFAAWILSIAERSVGSLPLLMIRKAKPLVEVNGIEPMTSCLQSRRSPN